MANKDKPSDLDDFERAMGNTQRMTNDKVDLRPKAPSSIRVRNENWETERPLTPVHSNDVLHFVRKPCPSKLVAKLKRGQIPAEDTIDLHGMTVEQAKQYFDEFLNECTANESFCVCIVHGKGRKNSDTPILKNKVNEWLRQDARVVAFHSAPTRQGGTGAVLVLLK